MAEEDCGFPGAHKCVIHQLLDTQEAPRQILWTGLCLDLSEQVGAGLSDPYRTHRFSEKGKRRKMCVLQGKDNLLSVAHFFTER